MSFKFAAFTEKYYIAVTNTYKRVLMLDRE